ncbi:MAG TPA: hypothetical protein VLB74_08585 [Flavobacterium sp.]|uniref:hypothetical protein n=1 Tax=Flavobacterium sp. TaxID=239 RepID=UPI002C614B72|nr:hypothetical protein [Flavobacterium sp.]HSD14690.1 hypothetical protein [Flavobacterium sp.]
MRLKIGVSLFLTITGLSFVAGLFFSCQAKKAISQNDTIKERNYIPYYLKVYEADSLYITKNYQRSYAILDSLFQKYEPINMDVYYEYLTYLELKSMLKVGVSEKEFASLVAIHGYTLENIHGNDYLSKEKNSSVVETNYESLRNKYLSGIDLKLRDSIKKMKVDDQRFRGANYQQNIDKQRAIDARHAIKLKAIFENIGYPGKKIIGNYSVDKVNFVEITTMLLHTNDEERLSYFMPKVKEFVESGADTPWVYGVMYDQYLLYNGKEQFYGTYENELQISKSEVNKHRREIGLPNYGYEKWRTNNNIKNQII